MHGIYLSAKNGSEGFRVPINPEKIEVVGSGNGEVFAISKLGNINVPKDVDLDEFQFSSFFPTQDYSFAVAPLLPPSFYLDTINKWRAEKETPRLMYVNGSFAINELVTIESFKYDETAGSEDVNYSFTLMKYVPFSPKKMTVVKAKGSSAANAPNAGKAVVKKEAPARQDSKPVPKTYSLVKGDSLWKIAQKYTGNGSNYRELQKLNGIKDSQLRKLPIGLKVKIPPEWNKK